MRKKTIDSDASSGVAVPPLKETVGNGYATILELVTNEHIYLINFYGRIYELDGGRDVLRDLLDDRLVGVGKNVVGIMFGGCLVLLPADVAVKNLGYLRPVSVPRTNRLVTRRGTRVYDLQRDMQGLYLGEWTQVNLDKVARVRSMHGLDGLRTLVVPEVAKRKAVDAASRRLTSS